MMQRIKPPKSWGANQAEDGQRKYPSFIAHDQKKLLNAEQVFLQQLHRPEVADTSRSSDKLAIGCL